MDRILTVNFDPLLVKACALVNFFPAIYDLAGNSQFKPRRIAPQSVFFLHGQHTGFVMLNGTDELNEHKTKLTQIVQNTGVNRLWLVVGYSGEADPLLDVLAEQEIFDGDLYWLGYETTPSERLLKSGLFEKGRRAFYVGGQDADKCLTHLAQALECFPPSFLVKPFEHLRQIVEPIDFETGGQAALSMRDGLFSKLENLVQQENSLAQQDTSKAKAWLLAGEPHRVIEWFEQLPDKTQEAMELVSWAHTMIGVEQGTEAQTIQSTDLPTARSLWSKAGQKYAQALAIKPDMHEAAYNWGCSLNAEAQAIHAKDLPAAQKLWSQAGQKYAQALTIKPDMHEAANNWGNALSAEARAIQTTNLDLARLLWSQAGEKYAQALVIKPDKHEAANNWGAALDDEAQVIQAIDLPAARLLWSQAGKKYAQALVIKPDMHEAANNWGNALSAEARAIQTTNLDLARLLWSQAGEKYAQALVIKPDKHAAANNWGNALSAEARAIQTTNLDLARLLWSQAGEKYAQTLTIKPDKHEAAYNWGVALAAEAIAIQAIDLPAARLLWSQAGEKYAQALVIKPDMHEAAINWGAALADEARAIQAIDLPAARLLWSQAGEKYAQALVIKPDMHEAAINWGAALAAEARAIQATDLPAAQSQLNIPSNPAEAETYLTRTIALLEKHSAMSREGREVVAYNLACAYSLQGRAADAVGQLDICIAANKLAPHWRDEKDFEPIRHTPEFLAWVEKNFPETKAAPI
jgi:Tfp pilus assembly protein PilF